MQEPPTSDVVSEESNDGGWLVQGRPASWKMLECVSQSSQNLDHHIKELLFLIVLGTHHSA